MKRNERISLATVWCAFSLIGLVRELLGGGQFTDFEKPGTWLQWSGALFFKVILLGLFWKDFSKPEIGFNKMAFWLIATSIVISIPGRIYHELGDLLAASINGIVFTMATVGLLVMLIRDRALGLSRNQQTKN